LRACMRMSGCEAWVGRVRRCSTIARGDGGERAPRAPTRSSATFRRPLGNEQALPFGLRSLAITGPPDAARIGAISGVRGRGGFAQVPERNRDIPPELWQNRMLARPSCRWRASRSREAWKAGWRSGNSQTRARQGARFRARADGRPSGPR
jgi:hypothetical protein